jgi:1-aminocyclopropane-1-carboxylate deaminase/D-cysteine desulfhydrase-like pyridoxal-dependent ACC family enzyme
MNTTEELKFVKDIAAATGIVLDPVYRCAILSFFMRCDPVC